MRKFSMVVLENLIQKHQVRTRRTKDLIARYDPGFAEGWFMFVPSCFKPALDIELTPRMVNKRKEIVWTQGSWFNFQRGDTLYSHMADSCSSINPIAAEHDRLSLRVVRAKPAIPASKWCERDSGFVDFGIFIPNEDSESPCPWLLLRTESVTQDKFIEILINGPYEI